jgi:hypothetical protein
MEGVYENDLDTVMAEGSQPGEEIQDDLENKKKFLA